jgi:hypothetical protein
VHLAVVVVSLGNQIKVVSAPVRRVGRLVVCL